MPHLLAAVGDDLVVTLEYSLRLDDGREIDRSDSEEPLQFLQGHGQIIPGLENALYGMTIGEEKHVVVEPAKGYGEYDPEDVDTMPRDAFPADLRLAKGVRLALRDSDTGEQFEATVTEVRPENVALDFNHPLAGRTLYFDVKVAGLRQATDEELAHGHVHAPGQSH